MFVSFQNRFAPEPSETLSPSPEPTSDNSTDPIYLKNLLGDLAKDDQSAFIFAWVDIVKSPLSVKALETAVALCLKPACQSLAELNEVRPKLDEILSKHDGTILKVVEDDVSFANQSVNDFFARNKPLDGFELWGSEPPELWLARACVQYLGLNDFRDLPLPTGRSGFRSELLNSDPFLTYASCNWHKHVHSIDDARALQPALDKIINPALNCLYLWTDQSTSHSSHGGPRRFFRSRSEVAIERNIPWLAQYLLAEKSLEPEDLFPARDLSRITRDAPTILKLLIEQKPQYYRPAINKTVLAEATQLNGLALKTLQLILSDHDSRPLPAKLLQNIARNPEGAKMFDFLIDNLGDISITNKMLSAAAANHNGGTDILRLFFRKDPSIRVAASMISGALSNWNGENLHLLFEHDKAAPVSEATLIELVRRAPDKFPVLLKAKPDLHITPKVIEAAAELNRSEMIRLIFDTFQDVEITEGVLKNAAFSHAHEIQMAEYLVDRCDPNLITADVLHSAVRRWNSPDKMIALLLRHRQDIEITDEMLIDSAREYEGKPLDVLLEHRGGEQVPNQVVDKAVAAKKAQLSWSWYTPKDDEPTMLKTLQKRVPNDPYLISLLEKTDFTPPAPRDLSATHSHATDIPNAAQQSNIEKVKSLLEEGGDVNAQFGSTCSCDQNKGSGTALQRAVKQQHFDMVKVLLEKGANPNLQEGAFGNPLQEAAMAGDLELVKLLVEHRATIDLQGGIYGSPLIAATRADDSRIVDFLLKSGADINFTDDHGWTPYMHAVAYESYDATRFLLSVDSSLASIPELIALPPGKMVKIKDDSTVCISEDGLNVTTDTTQPDELKLRLGIRSDHPMIPTLPFYYEMTIVRAGGDGVIGIGFTDESTVNPHPCIDTRRYRRGRGMPGWATNSWGYHGDDGHAFEEGSRQLVAPLPKFGAGDVVGCGVDFGAKTAYFTKNGERLDTTFYMISGRLYPVIGLGDQGTEITVNFGDAPFLFQG